MIAVEVRSGSPWVEIEGARGEVRWYRVERLPLRRGESFRCRLYRDDGEASYEVALSQDGRQWCECPAHQYGQRNRPNPPRRDRQCKHGRAAQAVMEFLASLAVA